MKNVESNVRQFEIPSIPTKCHINLGNINIFWTAEINHNHSDHHNLITKIERHGYNTTTRRIFHSVSQTLQLLSRM